MASGDDKAVIGEEELLRAQAYGLLARLLGTPPDPATLKAVAAIEGDAGSDLGRALDALSRTARATNAAAVTREYNALFIGIGQGELVPFGSYYLTGFLNEKPLAELRSDMAELGIARSEDHKEPEDHIAALCEMMAGLITGAFGDPADLETQQHFYDTHVGPWAPRFFQDLEAAPSAVFYMPVGAFGRSFLAVERQAFDLAA